MWMFKSIPCVGGIGFAFFPPDWTSFQIPSNATNSTVVYDSLGNYSYLALALILMMQFAANMGISIVPIMLISEVFPFK